MSVRDLIQDRLRGVFPPPQVSALADCFATLHDGVAKAADLARLQGTLSELAAAQLQTQKHLSDLTAAQAVLAARVDDLAAAQKRTEERLEALAGRVGDLAAAQRHTEKELSAVAAMLQKMADNLERLQAQMDGFRGERAGEKYEQFIRKGGFALFHGGRDYAEEIEPKLRHALLAGTLQRKDFLAVQALDFLWWKEPRGEAPHVLAGEVSIVIDGTDVERAWERARVVESVVDPGVQVIPVVVGQDFTGYEVRMRATTSGVESYVDGARQHLSPRLAELVAKLPEDSADGSPGTG